MGRGEALVRDANEGGQSFAARPGEVEDAALGSALMASGIATALSPSARHVVACSTEQMVSRVAGSTGREGKSAGAGTHGQVVAAATGTHFLPLTSTRLWFVMT